MFDGVWLCYCSLVVIVFAAADHCTLVGSECFNGGTCDRVTGRCVCLDGFVGDRCETDLDECVSRPCLNEGSCRQTLPNGFECHCTAYYIGDLCEKSETVFHTSFVIALYCCLLCAASVLYSYGNPQDDVRLGRGDDAVFGPFFIDFCFPVGLLRHHQFYVCLDLYLVINL